MQQPIHVVEAETTIGSQINRVGKFLTDFKRLPWIANHVSSEYEPSESRRAREREKQKKQGISWYTKEQRDELDLLATPTMEPNQPAQTARSAQPRPQMRVRDIDSPGSSPRHRQHTNNSSPSRGAATAIRPTHTPRSMTSRDLLSPGVSSHGHGHHSHSTTYHYANAMGQPMILLPSALTPPRESARESELGSPSSSRVEAAQGIPVYLLAAPANLIMPSPRSGHRHHHSPRPDQPGSSIALPRSPPSQPSPRIHRSPATRAE